MFFISPSNLIMPNRGLNMGDGWETKRRRDDGNDWAVIKLGLPGTIRKVILDTAHFKGNYPDQFSLQAAHSTNTDDKNLSWQTILEKTPLRADYEHLFIRQLLCAEDEQFTHIKVHIYPDGGISRLRIFGFPNWGAK
jgi:allantoicase